MSILSYCFTLPRKPKAEEAYVKNKIIVYIVEMISSLDRFLKKAAVETNEKKLYFDKVP